MNNLLRCIINLEALKKQIVLKTLSFTKINNQKIPLILLNSNRIDILSYGIMICLNFARKIYDIFQLMRGPKARALFDDTSELFLQNLIDIFIFAGDVSFFLPSKLGVK